MKACVVGGGTAGWITLSYLAATTDLDLTIIHTDEIEIIGVGESTTPALKKKLSRKRSSVNKGGDAVS